MGNEAGHIVATLRFLSTSEGGRKTALPFDSHRCILCIDGLNFDVVILLGGTHRPSPGDTVRVPLFFGSPDLAMRHCAIGKAFTLREGHTTAVGTIDEIVDGASRQEAT